VPIVHIHVAVGRTAPQKKALLDAVHAALVDAFRIPESDRNQIFHEHAPEHFESRHGPGFTLVEATVFPGRTAEAKKRLFAAIARNLEAGAGVDPAKVLIVLHEPALECWGIRGGKPATEVAIGFELDV
jgi:phenylpyruvate tautomerase PptA (4-oxalocrotonate tautomerase family)